MTADLPILTSVRNPWIRQVRHLQQAKGRRQQACFLVEGTHLVQEAVAAAWPLAALCFTEGWAGKYGDTIARLPGRVRQQLVGDRVLDAIATTKTPDGVVAIAHHQPLPMPVGSIALGIAVETMQDPGNLGTLIRAAAAVGANGIWLSPDSVDPEHPKVLRASAGQWFRQPPRVTDLADWVRVCRDRGAKVLAASGDRHAPVYWDCHLARPTLLLLGNEGAGLSDELLHLADDLVRVPMAAGVESLNVSVAGALLLYEALRQRRSVGTANSPFP